MQDISFARNQLRLQLDAPVARIILNRPDKRHAITQDMWEALPEALAAAESDAGTKVIVLTSSTRDAFCAGADIEEFAAFARDSGWRQVNQNAIATTQKMLARTVKPSIAQISGVCVGGGCGLAIACDFRIADTTARLGITPAKLGLVYSLHDTKLLVDIVGPAQAKMILFTGALFPADTCQRMGLLSDVVAPDDLQASVNTLAATLAANSQHSIRHIKKIVRQIVEGVHADTDEQTALFFDAFDGPDHLEGVAAFLAKRKPNFPVT
jgi:enoyl-CoA hydratase/carnithine racemase